uniref:Large ribosomal subunit protein uL3c n=1 Tax=Phaeophyceae sp. TaxID=2249243 RepID=A0A8E5BDG0_9PHAE|nr:ribosomal protein L3 [Phaeophyceae sp.]
MCIGVFGNKVGMTQIVKKNGLVFPVTVLKIKPAIITQLKTKQIDGYTAIQLGHSNSLKRKNTKINKAELGHLIKKNLPLCFSLSEYRTLSVEQYKIGQRIDTNLFNIGQLVKVTSKSIGKGFSGNQKRHQFKRGPMTHGSKNHRSPGSIGPGTTPGRVFPGKRMSGHLGAANTSISNLEILGIEHLNNLLILKGNTPGKSGTLVKIFSLKQTKNSL